MDRLCQEMKSGNISYIQKTNAELRLQLIKAKGPTRCISPRNTAEN